MKQIKQLVNFKQTILGSSNTQWLVFSKTFEYRKESSRQRQLRRKIQQTNRVIEITKRLICEGWIAVPDGQSVCVCVDSERVKTLLMLSLYDELDCVEEYTGHLTIRTEHGVLQDLARHGMLYTEPTVREKRKNRYQRKRERLRAQLDD